MAFMLPSWAPILELMFFSLINFTETFKQQALAKMHTHGPGWMVLSSKAVANISFSALVPAAAFTSLALLIVILRWYSRASLTKRIKIEDYLVLMALILSIAMTGVAGGEFYLDTGNASHEVRAPLVSTMMKLVYAQSIFYQLSINLVKASIILQYIDIFSSIPRIQSACYIFLILITGATLWGVFGVVFMCRPTRKYWESQIPGNCIDTEQHFWSSAILGIILDWGIWMMPIPVIARLTMPGKQKAGLFVMFGLGGFVCVVSILRLVLVHDAAEHEDMTRSGTYALIWSTIEVNVAIICASLLVMKPLFARLSLIMMVEPQPTAREHDRALKWLANQTIPGDGSSRHGSSKTCMHGSDATSGYHWEDVEGAMLPAFRQPNPIIVKI